MTLHRWACGLLLALAPSWAMAEPASKPVVVPFELLKSGHMAVMVKVNGKGPYRLIFDTGAPITLLNTKLARASGVLREITDNPFAGLFGAAEQVKVKEIEVGAQKAEDVAAVVMDHPTVEAISRALGPIEGIVGFPFFARYKMILDYQAKTMTFVPNGFKPPDVMQGMILALAGGDEGTKVLAPAAQWGVRVGKADADVEAGVTVQEVLPKSAAAAGGVKAGDRLLTVDGRWTDTVTDLYTALEHIKPGATVHVTVQRDGKEITLKVKPTSGL
jgi:predicted metalloprotease with PDZ domain